MLDLKQFLNDDEQKVVHKMLTAHEAVLVKKSEYLDAEQALKEAKRVLSGLLMKHADIIPDQFIAASYNHTYLIEADEEGDNHRISMLVAELR